MDVESGMALAESIIQEACREEIRLYGTERLRRSAAGERAPWDDRELYHRLRNIAYRRSDNIQVRGWIDALLERHMDKLVYIALPDWPG